MSVRRAVLFSAGERYATLVANLAAVAAASRWLGPTEVGVYVVGAGIVAVAEALRDFGASSFLIQAPEVSREQVRATFTVMLGVAVATCAAMLGVARPLASAYGEPRLVPVVATASVGVILGALVGPPMALLRRELQFGLIATVSLIGVGANLFATIALLWAGFGYISLALANLAGVAGALAAVSVIRPQPWIYRPVLRGVWPALAFGSFASGTAVLNLLAQVLPSMALGRLAGFGAVGLYSRAATLCQLPERALANAVQPVMLPALAQRARRGEELAPAYLGAVELLTAVQWPALACLAVVATPVTLLVLGPQWAGAAPLLRIMAVAGLALAAAPLTAPFLIASGRVEDTLRMSLLSLPPSVLLAVGLSPWGPTAMAWGLCAAAPIQAAVALAYIRRTVRFGWAELARSTAGSAAAALAASGAAALSLMVFGTEAATLLAAGPAAAASWLGVLAWTKNPLWTELRRVLPPRGASPFLEDHDHETAPVLCRHPRVQRRRAPWPGPGVR